MESELDVNKVVAEFVQSNLEGALSLVNSKLKGARELVRSKLERTYKPYLQRVLDRYSLGKSFFARSEPMPLYQFFIPLDLGTQRRIVHKPSAPDLAELSMHTIITGSGGSGKTMMMRHLMISTVVTRAKTPIFLELRHLNQGEESVRGALLRTIQTYGLDVDDEYIELALAAGSFNIMLDGFDELQLSRRRPIAREIQELSTKYPKNWIMMSSRPDHVLQGWESFAQVSVQPLDLDRAIELVQKVPFDDDVKTKFANDLRAGLFRRHSSFLSNPLLLSIMLLTYRDVAQIPDKLSIFYSQAYEALFHKHDALKGGFQREIRCKLDIQDFGKVFAAFCAISYGNREISFSQVRALEILEESKKLAQIKYEVHDILDDAAQAVCLLVEEGLEITFSHRSFQEYFVARFVSTCPPDMKTKLIKRFGKNTQSDQVMALLLELDPYAVERDYVLPALDTLKNRLKTVRSVGISHLLRYLKSYFDTFNSIEIGSGDRNLGAHPKQAFWDLHFIALRYKLDGFIVDYNSAGATLFQEFGGNDVSTEKLTTKSLFVRQLFDSRGFFGAHFVRELISVEDRIKKLHEERETSLNAILAGKGRT
jgi:hypothetical protein